MSGLRRQPLVLVGGTIILGLILVAVFAPLLAPYNPDAIDPAHILQPPSAAHWAGTDELGRDLYSRIVWGARPSLAVAFGIVFIAATAGTIVGCLCGVLGGIVDTIVMRVVELIMALPGLVIALA